MAAALSRAEVVRKGRSGSIKMHSESSSYIQHGVGRRGDEDQGNSRDSGHTVLGRVAHQDGED